MPLHPWCCDRAPTVSVDSAHDGAGHELDTAVGHSRAEPARRYDGRGAENAAASL